MTKNTIAWTSILVVIVWTGVTAKAGVDLGASLKMLTSITLPFLLGLLIAWFWSRN